MNVTAEQAHEWVADRSMSGDQAAAVLELLLAGQLGAEEGGAILRAWHERGETGAELAGVVRALRQRAVAVPIAGPVCDLCGTGGSGRARFNVSTTAAVVLAAAGIPVAKHGNKGSRARNGSFDLLEELGMPLDLAPAAQAELHAATRLCFLFARSHHPAVGAAVPYRKAAGCRTIFNLAGPLANPVPVGAQVIGTCDEHTARVVAEALQRLAAPAAVVVWGHPGIDEISITGPTGWLKVAGEAISEGSLSPDRAEVAEEALAGGDADRNAELFLAVIAGGADAASDPLTELVAVNAGAAIDCWEGRPPALTGPGYEQARALLSSGAVAEQWQLTRRKARELAAKR